MSDDTEALKELGGKIIELADKYEPAVALAAMGASFAAGSATYGMDLETFLKSAIACWETIHKTAKRLENAQD